MSDRVTVFDESGAKLVLGPNDHLATGGEGSVYARGDVVYKVYLDPAKALKARLHDKVAALRLLSHPGIAAPSGSLKDRSGNFLGITMPRIRGEALCKLFTNTWRDTHQFGLPESGQVVAAMREVVQFAHRHQALLVDGNELNWMVEGLRPVAIDIDSWQLPGFPATALMASIRDPLGSTSFSEGSDWFSWAIVTFQLWTGIHPFKGTHPDFARGALVERMKAGVSVFDPKVSLPAAVRPIAGIPSALRQWYEDVFARAARVAPPQSWSGAPAAQTAPKLKMTQVSNASLRQERIGNASGRVLGAQGGFLVVQAAGRKHLWDPVKKAAVAWAEQAAVEGALQGTALWLRTTADTIASLRVNPAGIELRTPGQPDSLLPSRARALWHGRGRAFALVEGVSNGLTELGLVTMGGKTVLAVDKQWPVNVLSTRFLEGCFVQDCLGTPFVGVLEGDGVVQLKAPALKGLRVVDGLGVDRFNVWLTAVRRSDGETVRMHLSEAGGQFDVVATEVGCSLELDGAVLSSGVGILRLGDALRVCKGNHSKLLDPCPLPAAARLFSTGSGLGLYEDSEVSRLSLI